MTDITQIFKERALFFTTKFGELRKRIAVLPEVKDFPNLTIFGVGSYARQEAGEYSDIDVFFLCKGKPEDLEEPHTRELRLFGKLIEVVDAMGFPRFSNDCQYLTILHTDDIVRHLGSPNDDKMNYFTARMLLLLESKCLYGDTTYNEITQAIVNSYFKDYPDHTQTFQPIFILNDICRFWKTLLLNYEHKRNTSSETPEIKTKQKVKNFKLKFSRMTTCFATIAALGSYSVPVTEMQVIEQTCLTPHDRLETIPGRVPGATQAVNEVLERYAWFLEKTGLPTEKLQDHFSDKQKRTEMFEVANAYGDSMFKLLQILDTARASGTKPGLLRYLVI